MRSANTDRARPGARGNGSRWRATYKVHPSADLFPMLSDEELADLGADIAAHGLKNEIRVDRNGLLIDGRNRLEAMERAKIALRPCDKVTILGDPVAEIIALNIHRRHLTKQEQADLIVAAHKAAAEAPRQLGEMPSKRHVKGKAGSAKDKIKAAAVADAEKHGIGRRTVERAFAKAEGRTPAGARTKPISSLTQARRQYLQECEHVADLGAEMELVVDGLQEIIDRRQ